MLIIAFWLEFQDKAIRNEADVLAALELPMLGSSPGWEPKQRQQLEEQIPGAVHTTTRRERRQLAPRIRTVILLTRTSACPLF